MRFYAAFFIGNRIINIVCYRKGIDNMVYVISDLHGCYDKWQHMLKEIKFTDSDDMYVLGDVVDYSDEPMTLLFDMMERHNVYPIMGEREYKFLTFVKNFPTKNGMDEFAKSLLPENISKFTEWIKDGGRSTFEEYMKLSPEDKSAVLEYLNEFMLYDTCFVGDNEFVFTHSGIKNFDTKKSMDSYDIEDFMNVDITLNTSYFNNKYMIVGGKPTFTLDAKYAGKIFINGKFIDIDCGCYYHTAGGRLGCLRLDDFREFYV